MKSKLLLLFLFFIQITAQSQSKEQGMDEMWGVSKTTYSNTKTEAKNWFKASRYAMFIHWGLYSELANQWKGETYYGISEWIMKMKKISVKDYEGIATNFNPTKFNAKKWVTLAKDAGMKYIVITAKHHDGFAMYNSSHPFNITATGKWKKDPIQELAKECKKQGLKLGFYYSQFQDWHEINRWDKEHKNLSFEKYFTQKAVPQVKELLTKYGDIGLIWFDTPGAMTKEQSMTLVNLVNKHQPNCLINSRIGNGVGDYSTFGDHQIPSKNKEGLWEAINTTNDSWGMSWYDTNWKGPQQIAQDFVSVVARGGNYMLNVGPNGKGEIPQIASQFLEQSGKWIKKYEKQLYRALPSPWQRAFTWGDCTVTNNNINLFLFDWKAGETFNIYGIKNKVISVKHKGKVINHSQEKDWLSLQLPFKVKSELIEVLEIEFEGKLQVDATLGLDNNTQTVLNADFAKKIKCQGKTASWMEKFGEWKHKPSIQNWENESVASWDINVKKQGLYFVDVVYNSYQNVGVNEWDVYTTNSKDKIRFLSQMTNAPKKGRNKSNKYRFKKVRIGVLEIDKNGKQELIIKPHKVTNGGIDLQSIILSPIENF